MAHPVKSPQVFVTQPGAQFGASSAIPREGTAIDKTILRSKIRIMLLLVKARQAIQPQPPDDCLVRVGIVVESKLNLCI
jgi:hypothetical protein